MTSEKPIVLLVDDDIASKIEFLEAFGDKGYEVRSALSLDGVLKVVHDNGHRFVVIFMDTNSHVTAVTAITQYINREVSHRAVVYIWSRLKDGETVASYHASGIAIGAKAFFEKNIHDMDTLLEYAKGFRNYLTPRPERDFRTALLNPETFFDLATAELKQSRTREDVPVFSLIFIDLDRFKSINDKFGHTIGDLGLASVASQIRSNIRPKDLACRYAGDEFVILLSGAESEVALNTASKIQRAVAENPIRDTGGNSVPISVSFGVGTLRREEIVEDTHESLLELINRSELGGAGLKTRRNRR